MKKLISEQELEKLTSVQGKIRGVTLKTIFEFVANLKGKEALQRMENAMAKLGCDLRYEEIRTMDFYPLGYQAVMLVLLNNLFGFGDEEFRELGTSNTKLSLVLRLFMKYFVSLDTVAKKVPDMWRKHYTTGNLKVVEYNKEQKYITLRLENFRLHPFHCQDLIGYFSSVVQMIVKGKVTCEETKCVFKGDEYHEYFITWR